MYCFPFLEANGRVKPVIYPKKVTKVTVHLSGFEYKLSIQQSKWSHLRTNPMLSDLQKAKIPNLFKMFDADNNGILEAADIHRIIDTCAAKQGWQKGGEDYEEFKEHFLSMWLGMVSLADKNQDEKVTLDEFLAFYDDLLTSPDRAQIVIGGLGGAIFGTFDVNFSGDLTLDEFKEFYAAMGLDSGFGTMIFSKLSRNSDRNITIKELIELLDEFFTSQDPKAAGNFLFGPIK